MGEAVPEDIGKVYHPVPRMGKVRVPGGKRPVVQPVPVAMVAGVGGPLGEGAHAPFPVGVEEVVEAAGFGRVGRERRSRGQQRHAKQR